jgi:desulfoferrodoxin-like iron-binding protein
MRAQMSCFCKSSTSPFLFNIRRGGEVVAVQRIGEKYRCNVCGNEVEVTKVGGGTLVCCGEDMELIS